MTTYASVSSSTPLTPDEVIPSLTPLNERVVANPYNCNQGRYRKEKIKE